MSSFTTPPFQTQTADPGASTTTASSSDNSGGGGISGSSSLYLYTFLGAFLFFQPFTRYLSPITPSPCHSMSCLADSLHYFLFMIYSTVANTSRLSSFLSPSAPSLPPHRTPHDVTPAPLPPNAQLHNYTLNSNPRPPPHSLRNDRPPLHAHPPPSTRRHPRSYRQWNLCTSY